MLEGSVFVYVFVCVCVYIYDLSENKCQMHIRVLYFQLL